MEVTAYELQEATGLFIEHDARGLSLTDCTTLLLARRHRADLATYDGGFAGPIACVPAS